MNPIGLVLIFIGLFSGCGAICDWNWFMDNRRSRGFVVLFGRQGARVFYALLGAGFVVLGLLFLAGVVEVPAE